MGRNREANAESGMIMDRLPQQMFEQDRREREARLFRREEIVFSALEKYNNVAATNLSHRPRNEVVSLYEPQLIRQSISFDRERRYDLRFERLLGREHLTCTLRLSRTGPKCKLDDIESKAYGDGLPVTVEISDVSVVEEVHKDRARANAFGASIRDTHRILFADDDVHKNRQLLPGEIVFVGTIEGEVGLRDGFRGFYVIPALCADFSTEEERADILRKIEKEAKRWADMDARMKQVKLEDKRRMYGETIARREKRKVREQAKKSRVKNR